MCGNMNRYRVIISAIIMGILLSFQVIPAYAKEPGDVELPYTESFIDNSIKQEELLLDQGNEIFGEQMEESKSELELQPNGNEHVDDSELQPVEEEAYSEVQPGEEEEEPGVQPDEEETTPEDDFTGLRKESDGVWYYYIDGVIQETYTGLVKYETGSWYYVKNGTIRYETTGLVKHVSGSLYYVVNGKMQSRYEGLIKHTDGEWYYVSDGKVQNNYTGLAKHTTGSWYYVKNGTIRYETTGLVKHVSGSWYYVVNGRMQSNFKGLVKHTNGSWYYILNGKKQDNYTGLAKHTTGSWYYIKKGKMQNNYTGLAKHVSGTWYYVEKGRWNSSFNGVVKYNSKYYTVKNGKKYGNSIQTGAIGMLQKAQNYSSQTKWLILVDTKANKVGIYNGVKGSWAQKAYWSCTTGASTTPTVKGQFTVGIKGRSFGSGYTCWYYTQFYGNYLFHSVLYNPGSMSSIQDGRLGINASHGCVRLSLGNAKWIYDNIPSSTKVVVY